MSEKRIRADAFEVIGLCDRIDYLGSGPREDKVWLSSKAEGTLAGIPFSTPPENDKDFEIGDHVEVYCDHDHEDDRVRDWLEGVVVKKGHKKVAVQFQKNVYLTDGWMVPDRVLWCPVDSQNIRRPIKRKRSRKT